jgi:hypothetical protein
MPDWINNGGFVTVTCPHSFTRKFERARLALGFYRGGVHLRMGAYGVVLLDGDVWVAAEVHAGDWRDNYIGAGGKHAEDRSRQCAKLMHRLHPQHPHSKGLRAHCRKELQHAAKLNSN